MWIINSDPCVWYWKLSELLLFFLKFIDTCISAFPIYININDLILRVWISVITSLPEIYWNVCNCILYMHMYQCFFYLLDVWVKASLIQMVFGQFSPRKIVPWTISPWMIAPRIISSLDNCFRGKLPPGWFPPGWLLPENYPKDIWPLAIPPRNCNQVPFGWFVAYIIAPWKTPPRNIVHRINYTQYIFSPRIRNRSTLIDSCFLLFSFFCGLN